MGIIYRPSPSFKFTVQYTALFYEVEAECFKASSCPMVKLLGYGQNSQMEKMWISQQPKWSCPFRKLPGGFIGLLMIASDIFAILKNFIVNSYIYDQNTQTTCDFEYVLVADFGDSAPSVRLAPVALWSISFLALRALESVGRGGTQGVYSKVNYNFNTNSTTFSPTKDDLLGKWNCAESTNVTFTPDDILNRTIIESAIVRQGLHYPRVWVSSESVLPNSTVTDVLYWSADQGNNNTSPVWQMNATVGVNLLQSLSATNFHCSYTPIRTQWKAPIMPLQKTLVDWKDLMLGYIKGFTILDAKPNLELILNSMTMVAASHNTIQYAKDLSLPNKSYGCKATGPEIKSPVFVVLLILVVLIIGLLVIDLYNLVMNYFSKSRNIIDEMPFDIVEWQLTAMHLLTGEGRLKYRGVQEYEYLHDKDTAKYMARKMKQTGISSYEALNTSEVSTEMKINPKSTGPVVSVKGRDG
ncbi:hypothetical protein HYALB_00001668 [Hymenoscyphus albidus]|uniref:Uncharacterized protein n=1 Tax=Hymenoscyphus albidus TaxID=595503 RepID=A0A9N9PY00_9HELO|nr:hypothetical protein HYALB_00001668 [Hymenoscyphus albidus]